MGWKPLYHKGNQEGQQVTETGIRDAEVKNGRQAVQTSGISVNDPGDEIQSSGMPPLGM